METKLAMIVGAAGVSLLLAGAPVAAHHAFTAEFDANKPVTLKGTVTRVEWINPHSWITLAVKGPDGKMETWRIEAGAPNALMRRGWRRDSLPVGTEVVVEGYRAKNGKPVANGRFVTFAADGKVLFTGSSGTGAPGDEPNR